MSLEDNPIHQLGKDVIDRRKSIEEALNFAGSIFFIKRVAGKHFQEIVHYIQSLIDQDELEDALPFLEISKIIYSNRDTLYELALCNRYLAIVFNESHKFHNALELLENNLEFYRSNDSPYEIAACMDEMAKSFTGFGDYDKAIEYLETAIDILSDLKKPIQVASCLINMGIVFAEQLLVDDARKCYESAIQAYVENNMMEDAAWCSIRIAELYWSFDIYSDILTRYDYARKIFKELDIPKGRAACDFNESLYYHNIGKKENALKLLVSAKAIFKEIGNMRDVAECDMRMASFLNIQDKSHPNFTTATDMSIALLKGAEEYYIKNGMIKEYAKCIEISGNIFFTLGMTKEALGELQLAQSLYMELGMQEHIQQCELEIGWVYENMEKFKEALNSFNTVNNHENLKPSQRGVALYGMARHFSLIGEKQKAISIYKNVIDVIESIRDTIDDRDEKSSYLWTATDVYYSMIQCCIDENDFEKAIEYVERLKSRNLAELMAYKNLKPKHASEEEKHDYQRLRFKMKALSHRLNTEKNYDRSVNIKKILEPIEQKHEQMVLSFRKKDHQFDPDQRMVVSYKEIKALINDRESALIELFPMEDKTIAFVVSETCKIKESTVIIPGYTIHNLYDHINEFSEKYQAYQAEKNSKAKRKSWEECLDTILKELYEKIFLKIKPHLDGIRKIILIPYHAFHLLPLHAMFSEDNGHRRYIIDDYQVTFAPSAKILKYCHERQRGKNGKINVVHADPSDIKRPLFFAEGEVDYIGNLFGNAEKCFKASRQEIKTIAGETHILHYAGHATSTALILHDKFDKRKSDVFSLEDIFTTLDLPETYLATLSACETGKTKLGKTDEFIGLTSGLLHAGAATVICSLWSVDDIATSILMKKMYQNIEKGKGKAESLRDAQLWLKERNNRREHINMLPELKGKEHMIPADLSKPYYWAGFICSGAE